jgi:hypothetical protein
MYERIRAALKRRNNGVFLYPLTQSGARKRAAFCRRMARGCK